MDNNLNSDEIKELALLKDVELSDIANKIVENNDNNMQALLSEFNNHQAKKSVVRVTKYNEFLDKIFDEIRERFKNNSQEFTNEELMTYIQSMQGLIDKSNKYITNIPESSITINQININKNEDQVFDAESRRKIRNIIEQMLSRKEDNEEIIIEEEDKDNNEGERSDDNGGSDNTNPI